MLPSPVQCLIVTWLDLAKQALQTRALIVEKRVDNVTEFQSLRRKLYQIFIARETNLFHDLFFELFSKKVSLIAEIQLYAEVSQAIDKLVKRLKDLKSLFKRALTDLYLQLLNQKFTMVSFLRRFCSFTLF